MYGQILARTYLDFTINRENIENGFQIYKGNSSTDLFLEMLFSVFFQLISLVFYSLSKQSNSKNTNVGLSLIIIDCCLCYSVIHLHKQNMTVKGKGNLKCILTDTASLEFTLYIVNKYLFCKVIDKKFPNYKDFIFTRSLI